MKIFSAPIQGYSNEVWRHYHSEIFGGVDTYFTPFLRVEAGIVRHRDVKALTSDLNSNQCLIPQIIFKDLKEFDILIETIKASGYHAVDLNMGCPFPPQVKHGRGSAVIRNTSLLSELETHIAENPDISFSVKMRLGVDEPNEWENAIDVMNRMRLSHIIVHPRVARQQYGGELHLDEFRKLIHATSHKIFFNGDITTVEGLTAIVKDFPEVEGVMIGRGLLTRPSLASEYRSGEKWGDERLLDAIIKFHQCHYDYYRDTACGDTQFLSRIKPFWDYLEPIIGHKSAKLIKKAGTMAKYNSAVATIK
jgi:tRNA-dihydrouridine synthase